MTDLSLVEAGFGRRIGFGSDHGLRPEALERAAGSIRLAPFLNAAQKRAMLHDAAARFPRRDTAGTDGPSRP